MAMSSERAMPLRSAPFFDRNLGLWLYGNVNLLSAKLVHFVPACSNRWPLRRELEALECQVEKQVVNGAILVCGIHNGAHRRSAVVPLRWGAPRIVVFSGGFQYHLGPELNQEPFRVARLWRYGWDPKTDLAVSRRSPEKLPTYARHNPSVDRLIVRIATSDFGPGQSPHDVQLLA